MKTLIDYVYAATKPYRKGEVLEVDDSGGITVITVNDFPTAPDLAMVVDVHFLEIGFTEAAAISHQAFYDMVVAATCTSGEFQTLSVKDLEGGPSYITLGAWLGSQQLALQYLALGVLHGLWEVFTPATLGVRGELAAKMAGNGFVMQSGFKNPAEAQGSHV